MSILSGIKDFFNGLSTIFGKPKPGEGDRKLAKLATIVEGQIDIYGKNVVRDQVIKSIESDMKRAAKKGKDSTDALIKNALSTPEYMKLLRRLDLGEPNIIVMAREALRNEK